MRSVELIEEISLTMSPACGATFAALGSASDEPRIPLTWWTGAPPLPWWLSARDRALLTHGQRDSAAVDGFLTRAEHNNRRLEQIAERMRRRGINV